MPASNPARGPVSRVAPLAANGAKIRPERVLQVVAEVAQAAGPEGMCAGQVLDIKSEEKNKISPQELQQICVLKTGRLLRVAVRAGAILADVNSVTVSWHGRVPF